MSEPLADILDRIQDILGSITIGTDPVYHYDWSPSNINFNDQAIWDQTQPAAQIIEVGPDSTNNDRFPSDFNSENIITPVKIRLFNFTPTLSDSPKYDIRRPLLLAKSDVVTALEQNRSLKDENDINYAQDLHYIGSEFANKNNNNIVSAKWLDITFEIWGEHWLSN